MLRKKILFWLVWLVFLPFLFLYFLFKALLRLSFRSKLRDQISIWDKLSWIHQSVYEKMVLQKEEVMSDLKKNPHHPDAKWAKERREIQKFAASADRKKYKNRK
jgi:hypothetical protein